MRQYPAPRFRLAALTDVFPVIDLVVLVHQVGLTATIVGDFQHVIVDVAADPEPLTVLIPGPLTYTPPSRNTRLEGQCCIAVLEASASHRWREASGSIRFRQPGQTIDIALGQLRREFAFDLPDRLRRNDHHFVV
jgi:hypothetical protein